MCHPASGGWPEALIAVRTGGATVLAPLTKTGERAIPTSLAAVGRGVVASWTTTPDGRTGDPVQHTATLTVRTGKAVLTPAPAVVDPARTPSTSTTTTPGTAPSTSAGTVVGDTGTARRTTAVDGETQTAVTTGRVTCQQGATVARCDVTAPRYAIPARPAGCTGTWGRTIALDASSGQAGLACTTSDAFTPGAPTPGWFTPGLDATTVVGGKPAAALGAGHALTTGQVTCRADTPDTMTCHTTDGAHGFTVRPDTYRTW